MSAGQETQGLNQEESFRGDITSGVEWTPLKVIQTIGLFFLAGLAEIGGGWLVWQCMREKKPWYFFLAGALVLVCYGIIPTFQPEGAGFGRVYAVYGGVFIVMSFAWGWLMDPENETPDIPDVVGSCIALVGVSLCWFYPRKGLGHGVDGPAYEPGQSQP